MSELLQQERTSKKCANVKNPILGRFQPTGVDWRHPRIPPPIRVVLYLYPARETKAAAIEAAAIDDNLMNRSLFNDDAHAKEPENPLQRIFVGLFI
jgi:hypothetical protein